MGVFIMRVLRHGVAAELRVENENAPKAGSIGTLDQPAHPGRGDGRIGRYCQSLSATRFAGSLVVGRSTQGSARTSLHPGL